MSADGVDCTEALDQIDEYLDGELDGDRIEQLRAHMEACAYCRQQYGLEQAVRSLIVRSCTCRHAPQELRERILMRITEIRVSASFGQVGATAAWSVRTTEPPQ